MKEAHINCIAKKIRNKLIYFIHLEMKKKSKCNNYLLINSMSPTELNNKYQKCSDYCVEKIETYSSCEMNNNNNNNYFHISVTYCSLNNNYHMLIDNRNIDQVIGENNIIGKYYKGNTVNIKTTINKRRYYKNINDNNENENNLEKMVIGNKKFRMRKKSIFSSLNIVKHMKLINENENNEMDHINNLNSNHNNYKPLININQNNDFKKIETNCANKMRKIKNSKNINIYTAKLKKYCSTLKIIKKRDTNCSNQIKNNKNLELASSPAISERKKNYRKEKVLILKSQKEKPKMLVPYYANTTTNKDQYNQRYKTENQSISYNKSHYNNNFKLKSQTKIHQNVFKIQEKKFFHPKLRAQSIDISKEGIGTCHKKISTTKKLDSPQKKFSSPKKKSSSKRLISSKVSSPKKISPTKKISSPKKNPSPKKMVNSVRTITETQTSNIFQKSNKRGKTNEGGNIKKFVSGVIMNKRRMFNVNNVNFKYTNKNAVFAIKMFKINETVTKKPVNKKFKRANTGINTKYHFKGSEIKLKENNF